MHHEPTDLEATIAAHTLEGIALLAQHIKDKPEVALAIAEELNAVREAIKESDKLSEISKKRLFAIFNKLGTPVLLMLKERLDGMSGPEVDPLLN